MLNGNGLFEPYVFLLEDPANHSLLVLEKRKLRSNHFNVLLEITEIMTYGINSGYEISFPKGKKLPSEGIMDRIVDQETDPRSFEEFARRLTQRLAEGRITFLPDIITGVFSRIFDEELATVFCEACIRQTSSADTMQRLRG